MQLGRKVTGSHTQGPPTSPCTHQFRLCSCGPSSSVVSKPGRGPGEGTQGRADLRGFCVQRADLAVTRGVPDKSTTLFPSDGLTAKLSRYGRQHLHLQHCNQMRWGLPTTPKHPTTSLNAMHLCCKSVHLLSQTPWLFA